MGSSALSRAESTASKSAGISRARFGVDRIFGQVHALKNHVYTFYSLSQLIEIMLDERAQGLHLYPGEKPIVEVARTLFHVSGPRLEPSETETLLRQVASADEFREFQAAHMLSCYHHVEGQLLLNILAFKEHDQVRLEMRAVR